MDQPFVAFPGMKARGGITVQYALPSILMKILGRSKVSDGCENVCFVAFIQLTI